MIKKPRSLTKTLIMKGFQCPKQLYLHLNHPELGEPDKNQKQKTEGTEIGDLARSLYPSGLLIKAKNPDAALLETEEFKNSPILFEAAYEFENVFCRVDILKQHDDGIELIEVKSSGDVKDYQIEDLAVQTYIFRNLGFAIKKLSICHINKEYTLDKPIRDFYIEVDMTSQVLAMQADVENKILELKTKINSLPEIEIGPHCSKPFACPFAKHCYKESNISETSVLTFPYLNEKWNLFREGKTEIGDLVDSDLKTDNQKAFLAKFKADEYFKKDMIKSKLDSWVFPLFFLDFETISTVLPKYPGSKPNTNITYQYSLFRLDSESSEPILQRSYISDSLVVDPRAALAKSLAEDLSQKGTILAYNSSFEKSRIEEMAELVPELKVQLLTINTRIEDLLPIMRDYVYLKKFKGSWSLKSVIPAIFGEKESYQHQEVKNGLNAQEVYLKSLKDGTFLDVKQSLINYCNKDVLELVNLYRYLKSKI